MTNPDGKNGHPDLASQGTPARNPALSGTEDLKIPASRPAASDPAGGGWGSRATGDSAQVVSDYVRPLAEEPRHSTSTSQPGTSQSSTDAWGDPLPPAASAYPVPSSAASRAGGRAVQPDSDVSQKKLIAGLLAISLGSLGVHKFYLGLNNPGAILLGINVGTWIMAFLLGMMMFVIGLALTLPAAAAVSSALGLFGLVEGIIYLTKSDADFERDYLIDKKPWL